MQQDALTVFEEQLQILLIKQKQVEETINRINNKL